MKDTFKLRENKLGFGWEIIDMRNKQKIVFHTSNLEQAKIMYKLIVETENLELLPEPYKTWIPRLLIIKEKKKDIYFLLKNVNHTYKIMLSYLKKKYDNEEIKRWDVPNIKTTNEQINSVLLSKKTSLKQKQKLEIINQENAINHNYYVDALENIIKNNAYKYAYSVFWYFIKDEYQICDFNLKI